MAWGSRPWSVRRLWALIQSLPLESATVRALTKGQPLWYRTASEELLATLSEQVDLLNRNYAKVHSDPKQQTPDPKPIDIPRPWVVPKVAERPKKATREEMVAFFQGHVRKV